MSIRKLVIAGSVSVAMLSGCATMFGDNTRNVSVTSNQPDTEIFVNGVSRGTAPAIVIMPQYLYGTNEITLKKDRFNDSTIPVRTTVNMSTIWNVFNIFGFAVDGAIGDILKISPDSYNVSAKMAPAKAK